MKEHVEEHLANLLSAGFTGVMLSEKGYIFALALLAEQEVAGAKVTAAHMARAAELVRDALPGAHRLYERRSSLRLEETSQ